MNFVRSPSFSSAIDNWMRPISSAITTAAWIFCSGVTIIAVALRNAIEIAFVGPLMSCFDESKSAPTAVITTAV
jgi:hypothetical protein